MSDNTLRCAQIIQVASIALFFTLAAFNNVTDFETNWQFVQHVLSMDTLPEASAIHWRAIHNVHLQKFSYFLIIAWEALTALFCWVGAISLLRYLKHSASQFHQHKKFALIGLTLGFVLYMVGFIVIGNEWFAMWQSPQWNGRAAAGLFLGFNMMALIFVGLKNSD